MVLGMHACCRNCKRKWDCLKGCGGFDDRNYHDGFLKDGYLLKVLGERTTVYGTSWYMLNHATLKNVARFRVVTWFGACSYRMFKSEKLKAENLCPACNEEMVRCVHFGKRRIAKDIGSPYYAPLFADDEFGEDGEPNYVELVSGSFGGCGVG